ncbi:MAG TPA: HAMP domain-containing sensor histidine kinase [Candidatus Limnocylindria bacterium]
MPSEDRGGWRGRGWGGRGWDPSGSRPPWWPQEEAWPPERPEEWRRARRRFARRAALFAAGVVFLLVLLAAAVVSALGALFGEHWFSPVLGVAVLVGVALLARRVVRAVRLAAAPMGELIEASARVEAGQLGTQVRERGPREVRALARAFNAMSRRLEETEASRRRLLADVSHELRTPLTVIQGNVEGMLDGLYPADRAHLERILAEANQLERLIDDLRTLSMADAGALGLRREASDLGALAADAAAAFEPQAAAAGVTLAVEAEEGLPDIELDPLRMRQVITNLVANAIRHTPSRGKVIVSVARAGDRQVLSVTDTGSGMDADAAAHAFDRFWRTADSPGAGLGLAIVRDLVTAHGGTVELRTGVDQGTTVVCTLGPSPR